MMVIDNKHNFGDTVYLATDESQSIRIVTGIILLVGGAVLYELSCGTFTSRHYDIEITSEKNVLLTTTN